MLEMSILDKQKQSSLYDHRIEYLYKISKEKNNLQLDSSKNEKCAISTKILRSSKELLSTIGNPSKKINYGRWGKFEHENFKKAILMYGNNWKNIQKVIITRTSAQIRSHAQKYLNKLFRKYSIKQRPRKLRKDFIDKNKLVNETSIENISNEETEKKILDIFNHYSDGFNQIKDYPEIRKKREKKSKKSIFKIQKSIGTNEPIPYITQITNTLINLIDTNKIIINMNQTWDPNYLSGKLIQSVFNHKTVNLTSVDGISMLQMENFFFLNEANTKFISQYLSKFYNLNLLIEN